MGINTIEYIFMVLIAKPYWGCSKGHKEEVKNSFKKLEKKKGENELKEEEEEVGYKKRI